MSVTQTLPFGTLLKQLRKRAGMTQRDLAAALGYSDSLISSLEKGQRLPDLKMVAECFIPALGLQDDPQTAAYLTEQAALARGERPPTAVTHQRTIQVSLQDARAEPVQALPSPPTELIGRATVVNQLCNRLLGHGGRLLTLVGPPGIGKTTLALAVATRLQPHYVDGVFFIALAAASDPTLMASTIVAAVGHSDAGPKPPDAKLIELLRRKNMLLVLDNLEQILDAASLIAELVAGCPGVCILATSRERLHLRAEQRYKVPLLALGPAVDLFVQRAQAVDAYFFLTPHNQPTLETICQRLDCLPLALELCAAQIDLLAPAQLLAQLQDRRLDLLVDGARDLPPQQRTLRAAIGRSYALLTAAERGLFRSLSVFAGGFDLSAVATVSAWEHNTATAPLLSTLHALIGKSLVRTEPLPSGRQRFLLLETIREFALEQARTHGEEAVLRQRHYTTYLQLFRTSDTHLRGAEATTWLVRLDAEQDNLRTALQRKFDDGCHVDAAWLMVAANHFWFLRGHRYEASTWLTQLLLYRHRLAPDLRLITLNNFYGFALGLEEFQPVDRYRDEMMALLENCSDPCLQSASWYFLLFASDYAHTDIVLERSVALARIAYEIPGLGVEFGAAADRDYILASTLWGYATFLINQGKFARAAPIATESLQLLRRRRNQLGIADNLGNLGRLALLHGDLEQAHIFFHEAVTIATTFRNRSIQSEWQAPLALVTLYSGNAPEAHRLLRASLDLDPALQAQFILTTNYAYLAETALWEGNLEQAERWLAQSFAYPADPQRNPTGVVVHIFIAARLATAQQHYVCAARLFGLADQVDNRIHYVIGGPIRALAEAALTTVREALDPAIFAEAFAAGQQMAFEEVFSTIFRANSIP